MVNKFWTETEIQYVKDNYLTTPYIEIGEKLNRTIDSIDYIRRRLKLKVKPHIARKRKTSRPKGLIKFCIHCGRLMEIDKIPYPITLETWNKRKYCSYKCLNKEARYSNRGKPLLHNEGGSE